MAVFTVGKYIFLPFQDNGMGLHALLREKYPLLAKNLYKKYIPTSLKVIKKTGYDIRQI